MSAIFPRFLENKGVQNKPGDTPSEDLRTLHLNYEQDEDVSVKRSQRCPCRSGVWRI